MQYGPTERMQNQRKPKLIAIAAVEGKIKRGRPSRRWRDKTEEYLNVMGIKNGQAVIRDRRESGKIVLVVSFVDLEPQKKKKKKDEKEKKKKQICHVY